MGVLMQNDSFVGGIDSSLVNKIGTAPLDTVAQDLSGAVNELKATGGGGNVDDVYVNGVSVLDSNKIAQINVPTYTATGNIEVSQQNVISRKEVWLNSVAEYEALQNPDPNTDYHVPAEYPFPTLPLSIVNGALCITYDDGR